MVSLRRVNNAKAPGGRCVVELGDLAILGTSNPKESAMPTMQARYYEDRYPIGRLVFCRANALGLTRRGLAERLGFRDLTKGHQALSKLMLTGTVPPSITNLADVLEVHTSVYDEAISATARQQEAEQQRQLIGREETYRAGFRPHLQIQTERTIPSPIFLAALMTVERLRRVRLPDAVAAADQDERYDIVRAAIIKHYRESSGRGGLGNLDSGLSGFSA
jgi:transcriptional regulator with XRE-family HTH domain